MPGEALILYAIWGDMRTVNINGGTASVGSGVEGTIVTLTPGTPEGGRAFIGWNVIEGDVTITDNVFIIGDSDISIEAVWEFLYGVAVTGGTASVQFGTEGTFVTLTPGKAPGGMQFKQWNVVSGNVTITGNTFIIGTENIEIEAIWEEADHVFLVNALLIFTALIAVAILVYFTRKESK
jgi:hypothetical protein